jgi:hypothetical protein
MVGGERGMKCEYCGNPELKADAKSCPKCGAPVDAPVTKSVERGAPFYENGFMVWPERDWSRDILTLGFWAGDRLLERISIDRELLHQLVPEGVDPFHIFWELFKVAHGETEVLRLQEQNTRYPATFEVRRIENPQRQEWQHTSLDDLKTQYALKRNV